VALETRGAAE
jgi:hypothetical protein